jgi:hypothetical protein
VSHALDCIEHQTRTTRAKGSLYQGDQIIDSEGFVLKVAA